MMLGPGSIEWGSKRSALETFNYAPSDLALCHRHEGEWVGLMNVTRFVTESKDVFAITSNARQPLAPTRPAAHESHRRRVEAS
jgi:AraC family transcriptional regulator